MKLVGRVAEAGKLRSLVVKNEAEFVAVYGRRRVGKTYLIRHVYEKEIVFECSGLHEKNMEQQLENFWLALEEYNKSGKPNLPPKSWLQAFALLKNYLVSLKKGQKKVVFLDEISWFETPRSGFLAALDNFWNQFCSKREDIILVICGSAASWIIHKVINDRGGLHNRITTYIQLMPFTLGETRDYLTMQGLNLSLKDITRLYMSIGGVPYYLKDVSPGKSIPQILDELLLGKQARLKNEFSNLYASLFRNSQLHEQIVRVLASKNKGLTRNEIIEALKIESSGKLTLALEELLQCGFIVEIYPIGKVRNERLFRLVDEYTLFYMKFLFGKKNNETWIQLSTTQSYKIWSGYAFENLCFKHVFQIKKALGIHGILSNEYSWSLKGSPEVKGAQIDFIIDRADNCINMLELKFHDAPFEISSSYASQLREKIAVFKEHAKIRKNVFVTFLTPYGIKKNKHYLELAASDLTVDVLFE